MFSCRGWVQRIWSVKPKLCCAWRCHDVFYISTS